MQNIVIITKDKNLFQRVHAICEKMKDCFLMWYTDPKEITKRRGCLVLLDVDTIPEASGNRYASDCVVCLKNNLTNIKRTTAIYKKGAVAVKQSSYDHIIKSTILFYLKRLTQKKEMVACLN